MAEIPPVDLSGMPNGVPSDHLAKFELRMLDADANAKDKLNREADQRFYLRWAAVLIAFAVMVGMATLLCHVGYYILTKDVTKVPSAFLLAVYVAPIVSITTVSLALLVAAFRAFKDGDERMSALIAAEGARATGAIN